VIKHNHRCLVGAGVGSPLEDDGGRCGSLTDGLGCVGKWENEDLGLDDIRTRHWSVSLHQHPHHLHHLSYVLPRYLRLLRHAPSNGQSVSSGYSCTFQAGPDSEEAEGAPKGKVPGPVMIIRYVVWKSDS